MSFIRYSRVAIVGASATGKTQLAAAVAHALDVPCIELDDVRWDGGRTATDEEFAQRVNAATHGHGWVIEGVEVSRPVREAWDRADAVVWLDHSRVGLLIRMTWGTSWIRGFGPEEPRGRLEYVPYLLRKMRRSWQQATQLRGELPTALSMLPAHGVNVVRLRSVRATRRWRASMESAGRCVPRNAMTDP